MLAIEVYGQQPSKKVNPTAIIQAIKSRGSSFVTTVTEPHWKHALTHEFIPKLSGHSRIILVGFGGSSLGAKMLTKALHSESFPEIIFVDNIDPYTISNLLDTSITTDSLFLFQSKSGNTPEVVALFEIFTQKYKDLDLKPQEYCAIVTEQNAGYLYTVATEQNYTHALTPEGLGGRFSVLSPSGLALAGLIGLDTESLLSGAKDFFEASFVTESDASLYFLAEFIMDLTKTGHTTIPLIAYSDRLVEFGDWYAQLLAESLGKDGKGFTPLTARGVSDQHSLLQLFQDGPDDKTYIFLRVEDSEASVNIPLFSSPEFNYLSGLSLETLFTAEYTGTKSSLINAGRPVIELAIPRLDAYNLGQLIAFFELLTAILGELCNVNTFDQPGVEKSKQITKQILISGQQM